jgi:uncharacterized protein YjiS (DUF1127 family)
MNLQNRSTCFTIMRKDNMASSIGANRAALPTSSGTAPGATRRPHAGRFRARLRRASATVREWRKRIQDRRQLAALLAASDYRVFSDLRVTRLDLLREIDKPFWRP